jgi:RND family efflux transporter MFP subunit
MGSVTEVLVREGDRVGQGAVLARVDARDIAARREQVHAGIDEAAAVHQDAETQAARFRALYADSAATRAQLDAAETGLARARAGLEAARAAAGELDALGTYSEVRAPFAGVVTERFVDRGAFVAPGSPLVRVEDASRLRVRVTVTPGVAAALARGDSVAARIEDQPAAAIVEGVVPAGASLYNVNAIVDNRAGAFSSGGSAVLLLSTGQRSGLLVRARALVREGDLVGVRVGTPAGSELRWIRTGPGPEGQVEVLAGLRAGERVLVPAADPPVIGGAE